MFTRRKAANHSPDFRQLVKTDEGVDLGDRPLEFRLVALDQAAGDNDRPATGT